MFNRKLFKENLMNTREVIQILTSEILVSISTVVSMGTKFVLAVYFFHKYSKVKAGVPLVWGAGFFFFGLSQVPMIVSRYFEDPSTTVYFALLAAFLAALSLALLYYGSALLFFAKGSFMRKKLSIILFVVMVAAIVILAVLNPENILKAVFVTVGVGFIFPAVFIIAVIFFIIWYKLEPANPRKFNVFLVAFAWLLYSLLNGATTVFYLEQFDWIFPFIATVSHLLLLYGMTVGKATGH